MTGCEVLLSGGSYRRQEPCVAARVVVQGYVDPFFRDPNRVILFQRQGNGSFQSQCILSAQGTLRPAGKQEDCHPHERFFAGEDKRFRGHEFGFLSNLELI